MNNYRKELKERITEGEEVDIITINRIVKESAKKHLKVKIKIRIEKKEKEQKWMREQIRKLNLIQCVVEIFDIPGMN